MCVLASLPPLTGGGVEREGVGDGERRVGEHRFCEIISV